ncbi:MAG: histidine phosphatase family protein [Clostridioides sp.]|jgi:alpha-ribazole phosphatase|nr:histidine phosphatase family protein [Clostridioides sp.]
MTRFILVRHAQTVENNSSRFSGRIDSKVDEVGTSQIEHLTEHLIELSKLYDIDRIYITPTSRTRTTIAGIADYLGMELIESEAFLEIDFGKMDYMTFDEIVNLYPEEYEKLLKEGNFYKFPDGESLVDSYNRVAEEIDSIIEEMENKKSIQSYTETSKINSESSKSYIEISKESMDKTKTVLICAHGGSIRNIISYLMSDTHETHWNYRIDNASTSIIEVKDGFSVMTMLNNKAY